MALLQSIKNVPRTFGDLAEYMLKLIIRTARNAVRVDFVTDTYPELSIKNLERSKREAGGSFAVKITASAQRCPQKWAKYLALGSNKEALIKFFVTEWQNDNYADFVGDKVILVSAKHTCYRLSRMSYKIRLERVEEFCSTQEEADTKIFLHTNHAAALGHLSILIKSSDTDVEVMALYFKWDIQARLYLLKGTKNKARLIDITAIGDKLGNDICRAMPGLHAFTRSDTTSAFSGKGKVKPLSLIEKNQGHFETMKRIGNSFDIDQSLIESCEIFVSELYDALTYDINKARYYLFCTRNTTSEQLPPTKDTLTKHLLRANY